MEEETRKKAAKVAKEAAKEAAKAEQVAQNQQVLVGETTEAGVQIQLSLEDVGYVEERVCELRIIRDNILTQCFLKSDEPKTSDAVKFYTGLPSCARLMAVFNLMLAKLKEHHNSNLFCLKSNVIS